MTGHDDFDRTLADWFQADALSSAPAGGLDRILDATRGRRPRRAWLSGVGSDWVWEAPDAVSSPGRRSRLVWAIVVVALVAALAAAAALVGSRLLERPPSGGQLAYKMNDDIYLADEDGAHPRKVTEGVPWSNDTGGGPSYLLGDGGPAWAPDGRHLLFFDLQGASAQLQGAAAQLTGHIADASGHVVASIPNIWVDATWAPDSTRIEAWTGGSAWIGTTQISIFGINGALQESLPLPSGYVRHHESSGFWAPDGRSVYVHLGQGAGSTSNLWQLPIDGSTPRPIAADDPLASDPSFTHDGGRLAFVGGSSGSPTLFVSNADGTDPRVLVVGQASISAVDGSLQSSGEPSSPKWSPDDQRIAYDWFRTTADSELRIVDVASGAVHTVVADQPDDITLVGWSPAGDELIYLTWDQAGGSALWTVNIDGTRPTLVAGAESGYWQPVSSSH